MAGIFTHTDYYYNKIRLSEIPKPEAFEKNMNSGLICNLIWLALLSTNKYNKRLTEKSDAANKPVRPLYRSRGPNSSKIAVVFDVVYKHMDNEQPKGAYYQH